MLEFLQYDFMVRALIAGSIVAVTAPLIGIFLVVKRYSLMADTLAHVSLVGVAIGYIAGVNPVICAIVVAVTASVGMEKLRKVRGIFGESVLAIFLSGSLAIASILIVVSKGFNASLFGFLFGNITTVSSTDLYVIAATSAVVVVVISMIYRQLFLLAVDEELAQVSGLSVKLYNQILLTVSAVMVSVAMRIVGVLLVGALIVIPVVTAMQWGRSFAKTMALSIIFSLFFMISGIILSFYLGLPAGGTVVLVALVIFLTSIFINK